MERIAASINRKCANDEHNQVQTAGWQPNQVASGIGSTSTNEVVIVVMRWRTVRTNLSLPPSGYDKRL